MPDSLSKPIDADLTAWDEELTAPEMEADRLRRYLQDGVDSLPSGFAVFDAQDRCVVMNDRFTQMLPCGAAMLAKGARFPEMARQNALTAFGVPEAEVDDWFAARMAYRESPENVAFDQQLTDGRWYRIQESRTFDGGTVTNWTDITDLKTQQCNAADYAVALKRSNAALQEFAHVASHDLKEPLRKIEVYGDRLTRKYGDVLDDKGKKYLDRMVDATQRMRRLIGDLLDYSSIDYDCAIHDFVALDAVMADVLKTLDMVISETQADVEVPPLPRVIGNPGQLARLFQNLLSNALKYVDEGVAPRIAVSIAETGRENVTLCIADNGIGIDQSKTKEIFGVFNRLHGRSKYEGTGIGLASCRKIAEQHGGSVHAESEPGEGSRFYVTLPLA